MSPIVGKVQSISLDSLVSLVSPLIFILSRLTEGLNMSTGIGIFGLENVIKEYSLEK